MSCCDNKAPTPPKPKPKPTVVKPCPTLTIVSKTVATSPAKRDRTRIGVGERVDLTVSPGPATWSTSLGGTLASTSGTTVRFTAGDRAAKVTVTAQGSEGCSCTIVFTIVEPSGVLIEQVPGTNIWHIQDIPSVGFKGLLFIQPADVSFDGIVIREKHCTSVCTGYLTPEQGEDHIPGADVTVGPLIVGKGSKVNGQDQIRGGDGGIGPPYSAGTFTWHIPWEFQVGSGTPKVFATVNHVKTIDATGTLSLSKGGTTVSRALKDPSSNY